MTVQQLLSLIVPVLLVHPGLQGYTSNEVIGAVAVTASSPQPVKQAPAPATAVQRAVVRPALRVQDSAASTAELEGQSATLLPNGQVLTAGGENASGPSASAYLTRSGSSATTKLKAQLVHARAYHAAAVLPDGSVLLAGGVGEQNRLVQECERYDPASQNFQAFAANLDARAHDTATLLIDGRLVIAGGTDATGNPLDTIELWDYRTRTMHPFSSRLLVSREGHTAVLRSDGTVRIHGGLTSGGATPPSDEIIDPEAGTVTAVSTPAREAEAQSTEVTRSVPANGATDVPLDGVIAVQFSGPVTPASVNAKTITLSADGEAVSASVIAAGDGKLAFLTPNADLQPNTRYSVAVSGVTDRAGSAVLPFETSFTTAAPLSATNASAAPAPSSSAKQDASAPPVNAQAATQAATKDEPSVPMLEGGSGVTALSGQTRTVYGKYLPDVTFTLDCDGKTASGVSDQLGRFLIAAPGTGHCELEVDGTTAHLNGEDYGRFFPGVDLVAGRTNFLSYTVWMTPIDHAHEFTIPSPTASEVVITNPHLRGLELHIPANTVIRDYSGQPVTKLGMTRIPVNRPPFPLPKNVPVPIYFTIQPGGSFVEVGGSRYTNGKGAQLIYPNVHRAPVGTSFNFWDYDPEGQGWYVYGSGHVDKTRKNIVPDPGVVIHRFSGAMVGTPANAPPKGPNPTCPDCGDPVDPSTGLFTYSQTDLTLKDVLPFALVRTYRQGDYQSRAFGIGTTHNADIYMVGDFNTYQYMDMIGADGSRTHFTRTSTGTDWTSAVYGNSTTVNGFYGATVAWDQGANGWDLREPNGTVLFFPDAAAQTNPAKGGLARITDRNGNVTTLTRDPWSGNLLRITTPNGRWIGFSYDTNNRVTQAVDNIGRVVYYTYDSGGRLSSVTDPVGNVTYYSYDMNDQLTSITDARGNLVVSNQYDDDGRVITQTHSDGGAYQFQYAEDLSGDIIRTAITSPRGMVETFTFSGSGYFTGGDILTDTTASNTSLAQTTSYTWDPVSNLVQSSTDALGRTTTFVHDALGNVTAATYLANTSQAVTTTAAYDPTYSQITELTDVLQRSTTYAYDPNGNLTSITNPLHETSGMTYNPSGQVLSYAPPGPAGMVHFSYSGPDLASITDPLGNVTRFISDGAGRRITLLLPAGQSSSYQYDGLDRLTTVVDALGGKSNFAYDPNGNLQSITDALSHTTTYAFDTRNQRISRSDPLHNTESVAYDLNGNMSSFTDRKGQASSYTYDLLDRLQQIQFADHSTITFAYDAANRVTQIVDSVSGTIAFQYDAFNNVIQEQSPQGTINYTYDAAGRRTSMAVSGQANPVVYSYDDADRLTQVTQGSNTVTISYDGSGRRSSLTWPNGIVATYTFDSASRLTDIVFTARSSVIGNLTYVYDANGNRVQAGGTLASTNLPIAVATASYNENNELQQWGAAAFSYDANGNLTSDGTNTYNWDARNQLASMSGSVAIAPQYDALGRRTLNPAGRTLLYDGANIVQEQYSGAPEVNLLTGLGFDERYLWSDSTGDHSFLTDGLNSTVALADAASNLTVQYSYDPFGGTTAVGGSGKNLQYTGRENDFTGLYYYRARYYSPTTGRFISEDPTGLGSGLNPYLYAADNPTALFDPSGLCTIQVNFWQLGPGYYHAYILTKDASGTKFYRAGPERSGPSGGSSSQSSSASGGSSSAKCGSNSSSPNSSNGSSPGSGKPGANTGPWGPLVADWGDYNRFSEDWDPGNPKSMPVIDNGAPCAAYNQKLQQAAQNVNAAQIPYNPFSTNSNAFASNALQWSQLPVPTPPVWAPGWGTPLPLPH